MGYPVSYETRLTNWDRDDIGRWDALEGAIYNGLSNGCRDPDSERDLAIELSRLINRPVVEVLEVAMNRLVWRDRARWIGDELEIM